MKIKPYLTLCLLFTLLISCKKKNQAETDKIYRFNESITLNGEQRNYLLNLPPNYYETNNLSLVIAMHGGGGNAAQFEKTSLLTQKANTSNFIVVYPDGIPSPLGIATWNAGLCCGYAVNSNTNDVAFISALIDKLLANYKINPKKVYATGHSNGGMMAYRLASELSHKIAAIGVSACTMVTNQPLKAIRAVPIVHIHSLLDKNVPIEGGLGIGPSGVNYPAVLTGLQAWATYNNCPAMQKVVSKNNNYTLTKWNNCTNNTHIEYYLSNDGGHAWAGGLKGSAMGDEPSKTLNTNDLIWNFFQQYQL
ncbi:MAG: phospholipase [Sphingobacteriales bacterium]|nr:MAG: phospholipase [Sphingobacteriales bacterium]TAF78442.1 MAG: phospholipase [Sphingobacteriales bacterium]